MFRRRLNLSETSRSLALIASAASSEALSSPACNSPQPDKETNESETIGISVCENFDSSEGVNHCDVDGPSKDEEADAQGDILFVPRCKWEAGTQPRRKTIVHRVLVLCAGSQALMNGCGSARRGTERVVRMTVQSTAFSVCPSPSAHEGEAHPWRCACLQRRRSSNVHGGYPGETSLTSSVTERPAAYGTGRKAMSWKTAPAA